jgi:PTS system nitrogen regulatory IIA component
MIIAVFPKEPIDFGALDGKAVHALFFLFSSQDKKHLQLLAKIAHLSANPEALQFLQSKPDKEALMTFIRSWEGTISN